MKLKSLDQNKSYQKRKVLFNHKDPFEFTPRLVIPEFNIPTVRQNDDEYLQHSLDLSERNTLGQFGEHSNPSEYKMKSQTSNDLSKKTSKNYVSFGNPSERFIAQIAEFDHEHRIKIDQNGETNSRFDILSDKYNQSNGSQRNIQVSATLKSKYQQGTNKRQSKYFTDKDSENKAKQLSLNSKESQQENLDNVPKLFKSNFSYMASVKDKLSKIQRKVIAIGLVLIFYIKLKSLSGIQQIRKQSNVNPLKSMKNVEHFRFLNELSLQNDKKYQQKQKENQMSQSLVNISKTELQDKGICSCYCAIREWFGRVSVIHPDSAKLFFFDITNFIFIILNLTYVPIETVINTPFIDIYGPKCIILSTNLGYYDKGYCIMDRNKILKRYMKSGFWIDILSTFPMFISGINSQGFLKVFNLLVILKIQWIDKFFYKYFEICTLKKRIYHTVVLKFFYILLKVLFFAHCFACIFLAMAFHLNAENTWVTKYGNGLEDLGWFSKYVYAFYWGITVMTTVGLGDILPSNLYEVCVLSLFMFVSCGTFAYSFNAIGIILEELNQKSDTFVKEMRLVSRYLQTKNVDQELQVEVRKYIEYKFDFENELSTEEEKIVFSRLSQQIQEKLVISTNMSLMKHCNFLNSNFSEQFLMRLCLVIESESKLNEDIIYRQDDFQKDSMNNIRFYILESGQVQLLVNTNSEQPILIRSITKQEDFGTLEFFNDDPRHFTAKAIGSTKLLSIDRSKFLSLLKKYPTDYEKFKMLCENARMNKNINSLKLKCYCCHKFTHSLKQCPKVHFIPNKEIAILRNMYSKPQAREYWTRFQRIKINSLYEMSIIQERAIHFQDNNQMSREECVTPYSPGDEILQHNTHRHTTIIPHKNYIQFQKLSSIPYSDQVVGKEADSPDRVRNQRFLRQSSLAYRLSTVIKPHLKTQATKENQYYSENHVETSKACIESNYSPVMTTSQRARTLMIPQGSARNSEMSQYGKDYLYSQRQPDAVISPQMNRISFSKIQDNIQNLKMLEFSVENFEKMRMFKTFFPQNNYDLVIMDYEIARPRLKYIKYKKHNQYVLFPKNNLKLHQMNHTHKKHENKADMTFMESLHI